LGRFSRHGKETLYNAHENGALPRDVIKVSTLAGGASLRERIIYCKTCEKMVDPKKRRQHKNHNVLRHPAQKPYKVTDKLIRAAMPKNNDFTVLVLFAGSGSECVSVIKNGGKFIGFEINPDYCILAEKIIEYKQKFTESYSNERIRSISDNDLFLITLQWGFFSGNNN
jgi:site-specific DNA-methyltransferase (adenine-specific)